jgi:hypothetical protein
MRVRAAVHPKLMAAQGVWGLMGPRKSAWSVLRDSPLRGRVETRNYEVVERGGLRPMQGQCSGRPRVAPSRRSSPFAWTNVSGKERSCPAAVTQKAERRSLPHDRLSAALHAHHTTPPHLRFYYQPSFCTCAAPALSSAKQGLNQGKATSVSESS